MNTILLVHNSWYKSGDLSVKGYLFDRKGKFYEKEELTAYFAGINSVSDFEEKVIYANGCFSVVIKTGDDVYAACDPIRAYPLFYKRYKGAWVVTDDANQFLENYGTAAKNEPGFQEFLATGYVTGAETLLMDVFQVQAGELIHFKKEELKRKFYYSYRTKSATVEEYEDLRKSGIDIFESTFKRFITSLNGRTVIVPLSGGFDSRLIAVMLKKYGYENVICITYGRSENPDIQVSRKVAEILGFKWICVEYTGELIRGFMDDAYFRKYFPCASNLVSMYFLQEYFAVRYLKDNMLIPADSIFAPGHTGDFVGGRHLGKYSNLLESESTADIARRIYLYFYCYLRPHGKIKEEIFERIEKKLDEKFTGDASLAYSIQEDWEYKEKLAKFIANSASTYSFFGYEFRFPYWDREIVEFFRILPLHTKINKYLYDDILTNEFFEPAGVNFDEELQASEKVMKRQKLKNKLKYFLPQFIIRMFVTRLDNLYYNEITRELVDDLSRKGRKIKIYNNSYNSLIIQWYAEEVKRQLEK